MRLPTLRQFFGPRRRTVSARAPGRLDVMGGIADYSGSLVLEMPVRQGTVVTAASRKDGAWRVFSREAARAGFQAVVEASTADLADAASARQFFKTRPKAAWAAYVLGCVPLLLGKKKMPTHGADLYVVSDVPLAKGLSSSASVEVASMAGLGKLFGLRFGRTELPLLCQEVENCVVGAPCGLMDQLTCYLGRENRLLPILCQPDRVAAPAPIPPGIQFIGVDSGVRHWVGGSSYADVRTAAFMGYSLIALKEGAGRRDLKRAREKGKATGLPYGGFLANIPPPLFESRYAAILPEKMAGGDFLRTAGHSIDPATEVDRGRSYAVRACARHPVYEHARVSLFRKSLFSLGRRGTDRAGTLARMGELMVQSHASYGACGLGEPVTDRIVEACRRAGPASGIYGAKITGGGSGGTVCVLTAGEKGPRAVRRIARETLGSPKPFLALGSSEGARWF